MFKNMNKYTQRSLYVTIIFIIFVVIDRLFHVPSSSWIVFLGCAVYAGFDTGTVLMRNQLLLCGTILGLVCALLLARFVYWGYELTSVALVISLIAVLFFTAIPYYRVVILITILSDLLMQRMDSTMINIKYYAIDRFMCLMIVFCICIVLEYFWFGRSNSTYSQYLDSRNALKQDLLDFSMLLQKNKFTKSEMYKKIQLFTVKFNRLEMLMKSLGYEKKSPCVLSEKDQVVFHRLLDAFRIMTGLYYMKMHHLEEISGRCLEQQIAHIMEKV